MEEGAARSGALGGKRIDEDAENGDAVGELERVGGTRAARRVVVHDVQLARAVAAVHRVLAAPAVRGAPVRVQLPELVAPRPERSARQHCREQRK